MLPKLLKNELTFSMPNDIIVGHEIAGCYGTGGSAPHW